MNLDNAVVVDVESSWLVCQAEMNDIKGVNDEVEASIRRQKLFHGWLSNFDGDELGHWKRTGFR